MLQKDYWILLVYTDRNPIGCGNGYDGCGIMVGGA